MRGGRWHQRKRRRKASGRLWNAPHRMVLSKSADLRVLCWFEWILPIRCEEQWCQVPIDDPSRRPCIALFEPEPLAGSAIAAAMRATGGQLVQLPDIGVRELPYQAHPFQVLIFNPFRSCLPMDIAMRTAHKAIGNRPILALTPEDCARQRTAAIIHGADDAIWVGGQGTEIAARMGALLRRYGANAAILSCDDLEINLLLRKVRRAGRSITMPLREFDLLAQLARSAGQILSRRDLLSSVWQIDFDPGTNRVEVHISRLRQRVDAGHSHAMLRTVKGSGYALVGRAASLQKSQDGAPILQI